MTDNVPDDLETNLPGEVYGDIDTVFQAWALLETALTMWLLHLMGVEDDVGRIVVERLDAKNKLMRIREIYLHFGNDHSAKTIKTLSGQMEKWVETRNILAHKPRQGFHAETNHMYFWTGKYTKKSRDKMEMIGVDVADLKRCATFAAKAARDILSQLPKEI